MRYLKGVGEVRERAFARLGVKSIEDLLFFFPRRYEDRRDVVPLAALTPGSVTSVIARVAVLEKRPSSRRGLEIVSVLLSDGRDIVKAIWFNMPRLGDVLTPGTRVALYGKVEMRGGLQLTNPEFEVIDEDDPQSVGRIVSVYPAASGLSQKWIRRVVSSALDVYTAQVLDFIPPGIREKNGLADLRESVVELHRPRGRESWLTARNRLAFDELFLLQTGLLLRKKRRVFSLEISGCRLTPGEKFRSFQESLPFALTGAQIRVVREILADLDSPTPMHRLLQGDVGSGKTAVAMAALSVAADAGVQGAFMVPTEILAQQHFFRLKELFAPLGIRVGLLTGSLAQAARKAALKDIADGTVQVVVGTHALFSEKVRFANLELVVVDEQHRFGVLQKSALAAKTSSPHVLVMTATPIPRTLTLSIYGDLDVSVLDELPAGRTPVKTVHLRSSQKDRVVRFVRDSARQGRQAYWVCPLIEESEKLDLTAAYSRFESLRQSLPDLHVALIHGQLPLDEKESVMKAFGAREIDLLVATSVIEVGVDVPNAAVMVIEDANRFGLAQLHQLRGRVGRGGGESHCILLADPSTPEASGRLEAMLKTTDGFSIAEMDLKQRGPGEVCGVRQHGVTDFRVADLVRDRKLLELARTEAAELVAKDPELRNEPLLAETLMRRLGSVLELAGTA